MNQNKRTEEMLINHAKASLAALGKRFTDRKKCDGCDEVTDTDDCMGWALCQKCMAHVYGAIQRAVEALWDR
jgi:hypothetical protein